MTIDWRVSAVAAGVAFILSLLVGVVAGVGFGALLLRAILWAALFAGGAIGVRAVVDRFLPELRESFAGSTTTSSDDATQAGSNVNIVVDEDLMGEGSIGAPFADDGESQPEDLEELDAADEAEAVADDDETPAPLSQARAGDDPQELAEVAPEAGSASSLPDIEGFSESFSEGPAAEGGAVAADQSVKDDSGGDAGTMARAIRTVLQREE